MKKTVIFLVALLALALTFGCGDTQAQKAQYEKAPDFEIRDIKGNTVKLSDYSGRVIILNFFATWCPPCRAEMPDFNEIAKEYSGRVEVIAVNVGRESAAVVKKFAGANGLNFTIAIDDGNVSALYGPVRAIPVTVIIDRNFNIAKRYIGARKKAVFVSDIKKLL
jgi:thiol-disulfide isomerase/thioredoxin